MYLEIDSPLWTNESFHNKIYENFHKGDNPLELLLINIANVVCLDYTPYLCEKI